ncbi:MAG TPA: hypothetical protein VNL69_09910 [Bacteroidota bacterium]|nr:hypothetical protein [Bacteroidota bacterium]
MTRKSRKYDRWVLLLGSAVAVALLSFVGMKVLDASSGVSQAPPDVGAVVRRMFGQYRIDPQDVRTRKVKVGAVTRLERRVTVPVEFNTLNFNRDLSRALAEIGTTVTASEKAYDNSVTMHIRKDGVIVESIIFVPKKLP